MCRFKKEIKDIDIENDNFIIREIIDICRKGKSFYSRLSVKVDSYALRNNFSEMSEILSDMADSLSPGSLKVKKEADNEDYRFKDIDNWYSFYFDVLLDFEDRLFLDQLEKIENKQLVELRHSVKNIKQQGKAILLSFHIAKIQIKHDSIRSLVDNFTRRSSCDGQSC